MLESKALSSSQNAALIASGDIIITYGLVVSSTTSPYTVSSATAFKDPNSYTRDIRGLFIQDATTVMSLTISSSTPYKTYLGTINLSAGQATYKEAFP